MCMWICALSNTSDAFKVSLIYCSDWDFSCNWMDIRNNDSAPPSENEWKMARSHYGWAYVFFEWQQYGWYYYLLEVDSNDVIMNDYQSSDNKNYVRRVIYLQSRTSYICGTGSVTDPFIIW